MEITELFTPLLGKKEQAELSSDRRPANEGIRRDVLKNTETTNRGEIVNIKSIISNIYRLSSHNGKFKLKKENKEVPSRIIHKSNLMPYKILKIIHLILFLVSCPSPSIKGEGALTLGEENIFLFSKTFIPK